MKTKLSDEEYLDCILIDILLQMNSGIPTKDCRVRFTKKEFLKVMTNHG